MLDVKVAAYLIIKLTLASQGIRAESGGYISDEDKFVIYVSNTVDPILQDKLTQFIKELTRNAALTIEFRVL